MEQILGPHLDVRVAHEYEPAGRERSGGIIGSCRHAGQHRQDQSNDGTQESLPNMTPARLERRSVSSRAKHLLLLQRGAQSVTRSAASFFLYLVQMIDTSIVRVHQHAACIARNKKQSMGRSRGGLSSKIHAVVDKNGLPVRLALTPGEAHDNRLAAKLLSRLKSGSMLIADRGYDADWVRTLVRQHGAWANIPPRSNRKRLASARISTV